MMQLGCYTMKTMMELLLCQELKPWGERIPHLHAIYYKCLALPKFIIIHYSNYDDNHIVASNCSFTKYPNSLKGSKNNICYLNIFQCYFKFRL